MWDSTSGDQPIGAIYLARSGQVIIGAAGATNCQGKGGPVGCSGGTVPLDKGNRYGIAIEAANDGIGEPWPACQQDAYVTLVAALVAAYDLEAGDVYAHFEWTSRKIDPAGQSSYASGSSSWNMERFREDVQHELTGNATEGNDDVTDDDVRRIAQAVWKYTTNEPTVDQPVTTEALLQNTRMAAANADRQTKP